MKHNQSAEELSIGSKIPNPYTQQNSLKRIVRSILNYFKINIRRQITPGFSFVGLNLFLDARNGPHEFRSVYALNYVLKLNSKSVLDVGSGGGWHANAFKLNGSEVTCIDFGTSIYAIESKIDNLKIITADFNKFNSAEKFELVWASHILEHQRNIGLFIEKLIECCSDNGYICITVPDPHRNLWGGHLSIWSPGLLAYNVVLCGVDLSSSIFIRGTNEFSLLFKPIKFTLPNDLTYDSGDLIKLSPYLPQHISENTDPWNILYL
jgi:2-polyprenyl-3-methyl-5-hydroxy-6-metoxy-1,4-benzoquinol methylase